ncbi:MULTISPECIES: MalY/PatB family protein [unclassified Peribacillus]|uniref:MalY/PatB family protein n=1 Tax=unclassified Peribacillus TaxID=2675266 RepID=UPI00191291E6|nr:MULTISPECIES: PatB family C-S lyase [unclassified Peribacillus]MBK5443769.1 PatB family C-S lyase [Peribacillus sp. TH24]MBK5461512.1 PatB family C-S lyase [Peribacillus sp. TH27]MBK5499652.1 PatB family C-S lyase [Peribacillus sp. TH14]
MKESIFEEHINRENTGSVKWDKNSLKSLYGREDVLPMWVADMDFPSPEGIQKALIERLNHPIFGYTVPSETVFTEIQSWLRDQHSWPITKEWISFSSGVVSAIGTTIQAFTNPGDKILVQSPVYTPFFDMVKNNDREVVNSPLIIEDDRFKIDFTDFEDKLKSGVKLFLFCSPHNPGGRVWTKDELLRIGELCVKYDVIIVSDEIHADLFHSTSRHYPIASLSEQLSDITVTLMAPSKTFNIAGIQASFLITSNEKLQKQLQKAQTKLAFHGLNILALTAMEAAYREGLPWLKDMIAYIEENIKVAEEFIAAEIPALHVMHPDASYLLWIDCRDLGLNDKEIKERLIHQGKLALEPGSKYGPGGEGFVRMNIGCSRSVLLDGLNRLKVAFS